MEKSKIVMGILAAATLGACQSSKVKISGRLVGADARQVYIEQLSAGGKAPLIDSVSLDDAVCAASNDPATQPPPRRFTRSPTTARACPC